MEQSISGKIERASGHLPTPLTDPLVSFDEELSQAHLTESKVETHTTNATLPPDALSREREATRTPADEKASLSSCYGENWLLLANRITEKFSAGHYGAGVLQGAIAVVPAAAALTGAAVEAVTWRPLEALLDVEPAFVLAAAIVIPPAVIVPAVVGLAAYGLHQAGNLLSGLIMRAFGD